MRSISQRSVMKTSRLQLKAASRALPALLSLLTIRLSWRDVTHRLAKTRLRSC